MRTRLALVSALLLAAPSIARAQDWDVGPSRPARPSRPSRPARPSRPTPPAPPPSPAANNERRDRAIEHLLDNLLRNPADASAALPALLRLVRDRDGDLDRLVADLRARADGPANAPPSTDPSPNPLGANLLLGEIHRQDGRLDEALARFRAAASRAPQDPAPHRAMGEILRQMDRVDEAATQLSEALSLTPQRAAQADLLRALMELSAARGDVAAARGHHTRLSALFPGSAAVRRELADALMTRRLYAEAAVEFQSLVRALAGDNRVLPPALRDLGRAQLRAGDADGALASFRRALSLSASDAGLRRELYDEITEVYTQRNDLAGWITRLQRDEPPSRERWMLLGRLLAEQGRTDDAIAATRRAVDLRPQDVDGHVALIQLLTQSARLDELLAARRRLVAAAPRNPQYVIDLADDLVRTGHRAEALQLLAQASARGGSDPEVHERLAQAYARMGDARLALRETELMARAAPEDPDALEALGERYLEQGDEARAMATWARIRDGARDRARGLAALAEVYARHDRVNEALLAYREALALRPDEVDWHKGAAVVQERARLLDGAIASWRRVIELARDQRELRREARARIVNLWLLQGRLPAMVESLERAFRATPPDLEAGRDLAEAYARMHREPEAEAILRALIASDAADVPSLVALERVRARGGDLDGAIEVLRRLARVDPRNAREWYQRIAQHALALHRDDEAIDAAAHAVQLNPDDAQGHLRLGELYRARGDTAPAVASLRRALALNDRLFPTYFQLADLHLGRNEPREAVDLYRRVIRLAQDDELVARAGRVAVQVAVASDAAQELERDLLAASAASPARVVLRRLLVDLYAALCRPLINVTRHGDPARAAQAREALARYGTRALKPLLDTLAEASSPQQRVAQEILGHLGNPGAAPALLALAERADAEIELRRASLRAAAAVADARALPRLVALMGAGDGPLASAAAWGVARIRTPAAAAALARALDPTHPSELRATAALGLAGTRDPAARAALLRALDAPGDDILRAAALLALGASGDPALLPRLRAARGGGFYLAAAALAALPAQRVRPELCADAVAPSLFASLAAPTLGVTLSDVAAAALVGCATGSAPIAQRVFDDPSRASSAYALFRAAVSSPLRDAAGLDAMRRFHAQVTSAARDAMALAEGQRRVLAALASRDAFPPLVRAVTDRAAFDAAREEVVAAVATRLAPLASSTDASTRRDALRVLGESPARAEALALIPRERDAPVAEAALSTLALAPEDRVADALDAQLAPSAPWSLRLAAVEALARSRATNSIGALARALREDPFAWVRAEAARGLRAHRDDASARAALTAAAQDADVAVRRAAAEALAP